MISDVAIYRDGRRSDDGSAPGADAADRPSGPGDFTWVSLQDPDEREVTSVAASFGIHELVVEDVMEAHQRPKLDVFVDQALMILKAGRYDASLGRLDFDELAVLLGVDFLVTVEHGRPSVPPELRSTVEADPATLRLGPATALHALVDHVVDGYTPVLTGLEADIDELEEQVFRPDPPSVAERIYTLKRNVLEFHRTAAMLLDPLERLAAGRVPAVPAELTHYFRDVQDHLLRLVGQLQSFRDLLTSVLEAHLARIGVRQNEDMRKISAWVAVVAAPTLIAGIYGMNFAFLPGAQWRAGFATALLVMAAVATGLYLVFRRSGWL